MLATPIYRTVQETCDGDWMSDAVDVEHPVDFDEVDEVNHIAADEQTPTVKDEPCPADCEPHPEMYIG